MPSNAEYVESYMRKSVKTGIKDSFKLDHNIQYQTADILRYTESGGVPWAMVAPTKTLVSGLSDLSCSVSDYSLEVMEKGGGRILSGDKEFKFFDIELEDSDLIRWNNSTWQIVRIEEHPDISASIIQARRMD